MEVVQGRGATGPRRRPAAGGADGRLSANSQPQVESYDERSRYHSARLGSAAARRLRGSGRQGSGLRGSGRAGSGLAGLWSGRSPAYRSPLRPPAGPRSPGAGPPAAADLVAAVGAAVVVVAAAVGSLYSPWLSSAPCPASPPSARSPRSEVLAVTGLDHPRPLIEIDTAPAGRPPRRGGRPRRRPGQPVLAGDGRHRGDAADAGRGGGAPASAGRPGPAGRPWTPPAGCSPTWPRRRPACRSCRRRPGSTAGPVAGGLGRPGRRPAPRRTRTGPAISRSLVDLARRSRTVPRSRRERPPRWRSRRPCRRRSATAGPSAFGRGPAGSQLTVSVLPLNDRLGIHPGDPRRRVAAGARS